MWPSHKDVLIIIPAYNEQANIGKVLDALTVPEIREIADVLVINDFSRDHTAACVRERGLKLLNNPYNMGYGNSIQLGYKYAVNHDYQYVIQMDADGQHDACNVLPIYRELQTKDENGELPDMVLGSRFIGDSGDFKVSGLKLFAIKLFRRVIRLATGQTILDPTSGLQGLTRKAFASFASYGNFDDKYPDSNMIMQMLLYGYRIREIPGVMHNRTFGTSMYSGLKPVIYMLRMSLSLLAVWLHVRVFHIGDVQ